MGWRRRRHHDDDAESKTWAITTPGLDSTAVITTTTPRRWHCQDRRAFELRRGNGFGWSRRRRRETTSDSMFEAEHHRALERAWFLLSVQVVSFQCRREQFPERNFGNETMFGFLAQDVEKYFGDRPARRGRWRRIQGGRSWSAAEGMSLPRSADRAARGGEPPAQRPVIPARAGDTHVTGSMLSQKAAMLLVTRFWRVCLNRVVVITSRRSDAVVVTKNTPV